MFVKKDNFDTVVIVDFGLAEFQSNEKYVFTKCGTPGYVAPEIANYKENVTPVYDVKCDLFSVGVIFHAL